MRNPFYPSVPKDNQKFQNKLNLFKNLMLIFIVAITFIFIFTILLLAANKTFTVEIVLIRIGNYSIVLTMYIIANAAIHMLEKRFLNKN